MFRSRKWQKSETNEVEEGQSASPDALKPSALRLHQGPDDFNPGRHQPWSVRYIKAATRRQNCPKIVLNVIAELGEPKIQRMDGAFAESTVCLPEAPHTNYPV